MEYHITLNSNSTETFKSDHHFRVEELGSFRTIHGLKQQSINKVASRLHRDNLKV